MRLYAVETGNFKLDGGAMFGAVPKSIWSKTNPADANNMIDIAARSLLVEHENRLTLIDTGIGDKQGEKFFGYYHLWGDHSIDKSLKSLGFSRDDITDVFLTHLHFDHCGGCIKWNKNHDGYEPAFKNARFWSNESQWEWAVNPNLKEKPSFLKENILPIKESGRLHFIPLLASQAQATTELGFDVIFASGHTEKQMIPIIKYNNSTIAFVADLIPTLGHIPATYITSYDTKPLCSVQEKLMFLERADKESFLMFIQHDAHNEVCTIKKTERGYAYREIIKFADIH